MTTNELNAYACCSLQQAYTSKTLKFNNLNAQL